MPFINVLFSKFKYTVIPLQKFPISLRSIIFKMIIVNVLYPTRYTPSSPLK